MAIQVKFAVTPAGEAVQVTIGFGIETEPGQRLDKAGRPVRPHFLEEVAVRHNDRTVLTGYFGPAMARRPEVSFRLENVRPGDILGVKGRDNRGEDFEASYRLA